MKREKGFCQVCFALAACMVVFGIGIVAVQKHDESNEESIKSVPVQADEAQKQTAARVETEALKEEAYEEAIQEGNVDTYLFHKSVLEKEQQGFDPSMSVTDKDGGHSREYVAEAEEKDIESDDEYAQKSGERDGKQGYEDAARNDNEDVKQSYEGISELDDQDAEQRYGCTFETDDKVAERNYKSITELDDEVVIESYEYISESDEGNRERSNEVLTETDADDGRVVSEDIPLNQIAQTDMQENESFSQESGTDVKIVELNSDDGCYLDAFSEKALVLLNERRQEAGLTPLSENESLNQSAAKRAFEISQDFSHVRLDGSSCFTVIQVANYGAGENIAAGQWTPDQVIEAWMNSPGHRENMLQADYRETGIACYFLPDDPYSFYWVQIFIK